MERNCILFYYHTLWCFKRKASTYQVRCYQMLPKYFYSQYRATTPGPWGRLVLAAGPDGAGRVSRGFPPPPPLFSHQPTPWPACSSTEQMLLTFATHAHTPPLCAGAPEHSGGHVVNKAGFVTLCAQARAVGTLATAHTARAGEC